MLSIEERLDLLDDELDKMSQEDLLKELGSYESKGPLVYVDPKEKEDIIENIRSSLSIDGSNVSDTNWEKMKIISYLLEDII